ncbi:MAG: ABC transporter permease [Bacteroidetes bacterium]|nr:ABC transporter permease [Bacteroidota bacterium]
MLDAVNVYAEADAIKKIIGEVDYHEIAVIVKDFSKVDTVVAEYQAKYPDLEVKSWMDISPGMRMTVEMMDQIMGIMVFIILMALVFGIVNTMLMAVLERIREIGMLMAVGMSKLRIFMMIMYETVFLSMVGGPIGLLLGYFTLTYFAKEGINLSYIADQMGELGYNPIVVPVVELKHFVTTTVQIIFLTLAAAIYPAWKALSLRPVEALRKI